MSMPRTFPGGYVRARSPAIEALYESRESQRQSVTSASAHLREWSAPSNHSSLYRETESWHLSQPHNYSTLGTDAETVDAPMHYGPLGQDRPRTPNGLYSWLPRDDQSPETTPPEQYRPQVYRAARDFQIDEHPTFPDALQTLSPAIRVPSPSDPTPLSLRLHKFLRPRCMKHLWDIKKRKMYLNFDIRKQEDLALIDYGPMGSLPYESKDQPATIPPCSYMRITHPDLMWPIDVCAEVFVHPEFTPNPAKGGKTRQRLFDYCSVSDVLRAIYETLHLRMSRAEYYRHTPEQQKRTAMAFYQRCRYMIAHAETGNREENGVRRIDVLGAQVQFIGLKPASEFGHFDLVLANRPREFVERGVRQVDLLLPYAGEPECAGYRGDIPWGWKDPETNWGRVLKMNQNPWTWKPRRKDPLQEGESDPPGTALGLDLG